MDELSGSVQSRLCFAPLSVPLSLEEGAPLDDTAARHNDRFDHRASLEIA